MYYVGGTCYLTNVPNSLQKNKFIIALAAVEFNMAQIRRK